MSFKRIVKRLRTFRVWHRTIGVFVAIFLLISSVTGILLSLKKDVPLIQPPTQEISFSSTDTWLTIPELEQKSMLALQGKYPEQKENKVKRIDVRPSKGIAKVIFEEGNWEVQLNAINGEALSIEKRYSDWIESLHDGSIISNLFKLISMNILGISVIFMVITGLWLYFGPKRFRRLKKNRNNSSM